MSALIFSPIFSMDLLPLQIVLTPLAGGVLIMLLGKFPNLREAATLLTALLTFALVVELVVQFQRGVAFELTLIEIIPSLSFAFKLEPLGALFALIASGLWIVNSLYSFGYMRGNEEKRQTQFYVYFAIAIFATLGIALSANLLTLFIFYEILTLSTWPLVAHKRNEEARAGARTYLSILLGTSIGFFFFAMLWLWHLTGDLTFTAGGVVPLSLSPIVITALFALFAFGTGKAALMPFHRWLPAAMVAPTPVSALLHAVAVVKAGVFVILKISIYIFGVKTLQTSGASVPILWIASFSLLAASVVALFKTDLKARLAYSTVSQLSYITLAACLATPLAMVAGALHLLTHAFGKITLFMCAGAIYTATHKRDLREMVGLGWQMPFVFIAFLVGAASITGLPIFAGLWSKLAIMNAGIASGDSLIVAVLIVSSLLNAIYLIPIGLRGFMVSERPHVLDKTLPLLTFLPPVFTAFLCLVLFFFIEPVFEFLQQIRFEK